MIENLPMILGEADKVYKSARGIEASHLLWSIVIGIVILLFMIIYFKVHPFIALLITSMGVGLAAGLSPMETIKSVQSGMGGTLGFVAIVVGLGAMFGRMLEVSGGAESLARSIVKMFGSKNSQWALVITGFLISIPVFLDVGLVILIPIVYSLSKKAGKPLLYYGIPLLAGLAVTHSFIPPTPGPVIGAQNLGADLGLVILFGAIAGIPAAIIAGPIFARYISDKVKTNISSFTLDTNKPELEDKDLPGFGLVMFLILLPLVMMLIGTMAVLPSVKPYLTWGTADGGSFHLYEMIAFVCHPFVALIVVSLVAFKLLSRYGSYSREDVQEIATKSLEPAGIIILVTGAGGVFKAVLKDSGVADVLGSMMEESSLPVLLIAFLIATMVRVAQGSATVTMVITSTLMAGATGMTGPTAALGVIAIACGATVFSHVNDSGFWLVSRFFGMNVKDTLKSWTMMETIIGVVGFVMVLIISAFI